jgi:hypothetical protein
MTACRDSPRKKSPRWRTLLCAFANYDLHYMLRPHGKIEETKNP